MQYIKGLENYIDCRPSAVTFGKFDGLHCGHQLLVDAVKQLGEKEDLCSVVCAFDMKRQGVLMTKKEREFRLENKIDYLVDCLFTKEFRELKAEEFIRDIIKGVFHAKYVVVGTDFHFGYGKDGDTLVLKEYAEKYGYEVIVMDKKRYQGRTIGSTYIREVLREGRVSDANQMLGYGFGIEGVVEHGLGLGKELGFPTCNILWPKEKLVPPKGVYLCSVYMTGREYNGIANIGVKPTVSEEEIVRLECYLFEYDGDAYGKTVRVELVKYIRPEQKFADEEELKVHVGRDIAEAERYFQTKS